LEKGGGRLKGAKNANRRKLSFKMEEAVQCPKRGGGYVSILTQEVKR